MAAVVGIDKYRHWRKLRNAVSDARGISAALKSVGFEELVPPLLDEEASGSALRALANEQLQSLREEDNLILFYAGHGGALTHMADDKEIQTGFVIPFDGEPNKPSTWIDLESWLRGISLLPPRHILVILDACHSGIALDPIFRWQGPQGLTGSRDALHARRSRRVITSALVDQRALDSGPRAGHSLFTGCLLEAIDGDTSTPLRFATSSELGVWLQQRVSQYPHSEQTPDFGTFFSDNRGEMRIPLRGELLAAAVHRPPSPPNPAELSPKPGRWSLIAQERDWLVLVAPLLALGVAGLLGQAC